MIFLPIDSKKKKKKKKRTYPSNLASPKEGVYFLQKWSPPAGYLEAGYKGESW